MTGIILIVHVFVCLALIIIVLLQAGKGADMGAAFGGASKTVFGPAGAAGPMAKITVGVAVTFMFTSLFLTWASKQEMAPSVMDSPATTTAPAIPGTPQPGGGTVTLPVGGGEQPITLPGDLPITIPGPGDSPSRPAETPVVPVVPDPTPADPAPSVP